MRTLLIALTLLGFAAPAIAQPFEARISVQASRPGPTIDPNIYGQFVEHLGRGVYEGIWVGDSSAIPNVRGIRSDVVAALRRIHVPIVRWPGGCFAETYHWRDAIGPQGQRRRGVNTAWGDEPETNAFGTDEFFDFLQQIGAKPFVAVNLTTGAPEEALGWLQYMTAPATSPAGEERARNGHPAPYEVPFIGVGNENWGCGGNMTVEHYADVYRQYYAVLSRFGVLVTADANSDDYQWTETLLARAMYRHSNASTLQLAWVNRNPLISMMSLHFYAFAGNDWSHKSAAIGFNENDWAEAMVRAAKMDELLSHHAAIMDRYDPERKIGLAVDEWGSWWAADPNRPSNLYQQNTLRDAVMAAMTLNILQNHADRVRMANIAQMINVLQSMILTRGSQMIVTPTYHVFDMYQVNQGATLLPSQVHAPNYVAGRASLPAMSVSASRGADGAIYLSVVNIDPNRPARIAVDLPGVNVRHADGRVLTATAMDAHPDFDMHDPMEPTSLEGIVANGAAVAFTLPAKSVAVIALRE